jgi:crossover junction endodeoxyribonuclease RuvC
VNAAGGVIVLGLDPGSRVTGYGVVREASGVLTLVCAGTIRTESLATSDLAGRLGLIFKGVSKIMREYPPDEAAVENVFGGKSVASALKLGQARGAALAALAGADIPVYAYEPTKVKKSLVGAGRAEKTQVAFMIGQLLGSKVKFAADATDALAVAVCHLNHRRFLKMGGAA